MPRTPGGTLRPSLTAGPVRPANRSREAGKEADRSCVRASTEPARAGGVFMSGAVTDRRSTRRRRGVHPPLPRASSIVDPRVGELGPGAAGARGRDGVPGDRVRGRRRGRRRPRRQHLADRLPGGLHRPLVRRPGRRDDLPADRQLRPRWPTTTSRVRPWLRALVVANATAAVARRRPPARVAAPRRRASRRSPASTRERSPGTSGRAAASAAIVTEPGFVDRDAAVDRARAVPRWEDQDFVGQVSPSSIMDVGRRDEGGPLDRDRRLRAEVEHRPGDAPARRAGPDPAAHDLDGGRAGAATSTA